MIKLRHPATGEIKLVEEGVAYQRCTQGWCWEVIGSEVDQTAMEFEEQSGMQLGDAIASLTKVFGIKPCSKCEQRRKVLNEMRARGVAGTLKALKKIGI